MSAPSSDGFFGLLQTIVVSITSVITGILLQHRRQSNPYNKNERRRGNQTQTAIDSMVESYEKALDQKDKQRQESDDYHIGIITALRKDNHRLRDKLAQAGISEI